jgi:hypothetical protein
MGHKNGTPSQDLQDKGEACYTEGLEHCCNQEADSSAREFSSWKLILSRAKLTNKVNSRVVSVAHHSSTTLP